MYFHILNENPLAPKGPTKNKLPSSAVAAKVQVMNLSIDAELAGEEEDLVSRKNRRKN